VNLLKNAIGTNQAKALVSMLKEHPTLKSLCGNKGNETELNMSGKMDSPEDAIMLVAEIAGNVALTKFDISNNSLYAAGAKVLAAGLKGNHGITDLNLGGNRLGWKDLYQSADMSGVIALADAIPHMGALSYEVIKKEDLISFFQEHSKDPPKMIAQVDQILATKPVQQIVDRSMKAFETSPKVTVIPKANGALTSLNLSSNYLEAEGAKIVAEAIKVTSAL
jgi:hypothetical protein